MGHGKATPLHEPKHADVGPILANVRPGAAEHQSSSRAQPDNGRRAHYSALSPHVDYGAGVDGILTAVILAIVSAAKSILTVLIVTAVEFEYQLHGLTRTPP